MNNENNNLENIKNNIRIGLAILVIISIVIGVYVNIIGIGNKGKDNKENQVDVATETIVDSEDDNVKSESFDNVESIVVELAAGDLEVSYGNVDKISVDYSMPNNMAPEIKIDNGVLSIRKKDTSNKKWNFLKSGKLVGNISVIIPRDAELANVDIDVEYGDVEVKDVRADLINLALECGDIDIKSIEATTICIEESLGDINIDKINCDKIEINQSAGDITVDDSSIKTTEVKSSLGDVDLSGDLEEVSVKSSMGDIDVKSDKAESEMKLDLNVDAGNISVNGRDYK